MKKMFMLAASLHKYEGTKVAVKLAQACHFTETRDEAIGGFVDHCRTTFPDFAIADVIDMEIEPEKVALAAREQAGVNDA